MILPEYQEQPDQPSPDEIPPKEVRRPFACKNPSNPNEVPQGRNRRNRAALKMTKRQRPRKRKS